METPGRALFRVQRSGPTLRLKRDVRRRGTQPGLRGSAHPELTNDNIKSQSDDFSNSLLEAWADDVAGGLDAVPDG